MQRTMPYLILPAFFAVIGLIGSVFMLSQQGYVLPAVLVGAALLAFWGVGIHATLRKARTSMPDRIRLRPSKGGKRNGHPRRRPEMAD